MSRIRLLARRALGFLLRMLVVFIAVEGICSVILIASKLRRTSRQLQHGGRTAQYDPALGWANEPNLDLRDFFGPGGHVRTNSRGFRGSVEYPAAVPPGKVRLVCTGDSMTFGYGVGEEKPFCHRLQAEDPRLETVNMGVAGYGVDQAYLLYRRESPALAHDIHVLSFINDDFKRMGRSRFIGMPKPVLRLVDGRLVTENVPVPKIAFSMPRLGMTLSAFDVAQSVTLFRSLRAQPDPGVAYHSTAEMMKMAFALFEELDRLAKERGQVFVAVFLPNESELQDEPLRQAYLELELRRRGIPYLDVTPDIAAIPPRERTRLFIQAHEKNEKNAVGHFSDAGNALVARLLYRKLMALPVVAAKLAPG